MIYSIKTFIAKISVSSRKMKVLYSDDAEAIRQYVSTSEGISYINNNDNDKGTPLYYACKKNRTDVVDVLIEYGADVNLQNRSFKGTPLHIACEKGYIDLVYRLLNVGANPNIPDYYETKPIMYAARKNHLNIVKLLTIYSDFNYTNIYGYTIFIYAIQSENKEMLDYVFDVCTNINCVDFRGRSYLHHSILYKNKYAIKYLLAKCIDINIQDYEGEKAYDYTMDPEILDILNKYLN